MLSHLGEPVGAWHRMSSELSAEEGGRENESSSLPELLNSKRNGARQQPRQAPAWLTRSQLANSPLEALRCGHRAGDGHAFGHTWSGLLWETQAIILAVEVVWYQCVMLVCVSSDPKARISACHSTRVSGQKLKECSNEKCKLLGLAACFISVNIVERKE